MSSTCRYDFHPADWAKAHSEPSPLQERWSCPREAVEGAECCPFHLSPAERDDVDINQEELNQKLRAELVSENCSSLQLVGATLPSINLSTIVVDRPTNNPIDLRHATIQGNLRAVEASFHQPILLEQATIDGQINVSGAEFNYAFHCDGIDIRDKCLFENVTFCDAVSFRESTVWGKISFEGSEFQREADFYSLQASNDCIFRSTVWEMDCLFQAARFDGRADFFSAKFEQLSDFRAVTFEGISRFSKSEFQREALFLDAEFKRAALFKKIAFVSHAHFQQTYFDTEASFSETTFSGKTKFQFAVFEGEAVFSYVNFQNNIYFQHIRFNDYASFFESTFEDMADFRWAKFQDIGRFMDAEFDAVGYFAQSKFFGVGDFRDVVFHQTANFHEVVFHHSPMFQRAQIEVVNFIDLQTDGDELTVDFQASVLRSGRIEQSADVYTYYNFRESTLGDIDIDIETEERLFQHILVSKTTFNGFDFSRYHYTLSPEWELHRFTGESDFDYETEASRFNLGEREDAKESDETDDDIDGLDCNQDDDGVRFAGVRDVVFESFDPQKRYLRMVRLVKKAPSLETTYLKAKNGADEVGDSRAASAFFVRVMYYRRYTHIKQAGASSEPLQTRIRSIVLAVLNWLLSLTCGYGEKPYRTLSFSLGVVALYSIVYYALLESPPYGTLGGYVLFSFQSFIALVLGVNTEPLGFAGSLATASQGFVGAFLIGLFVFTLTRSIHR